MNDIEPRDVTTEVKFPENLKTVEHEEFGGERALFNTHALRLRCLFEGKYPFWHVENFRCTDCDFTPGARAALWYSRNLEMVNCRVDAPKMFREMHNLSLEGVRIPDA